MGVPKEHDIGALLSGVGDQSPQTSLDSKQMPVAEQNFVPLKGEKLLGGGVSRKEIAVAAHGIEGGAVKILAPQISQTVPQKKDGIRLFHLPLVGFYRSVILAVGVRKNQKFHIRRSKNHSDIIIAQNPPLCKTKEKRCPEKLKKRKRNQKRPPQ
jgi:hypothetical protein